LFQSRSVFFFFSFLSGGERRSFFTDSPFQRVEEDVFFPSLGVGFLTRLPELFFSPFRSVRSTLELFEDGCGGSAVVTEVAFCLCRSPVFGAVAFFFSFILTLAQGNGAGGLPLLMRQRILYRGVTCRVFFDDSRRIGKPLFFLLAFLRWRRATRGGFFFFFISKRGKWCTEASNYFFPPCRILFWAPLLVSGV